MFDFVRTHTCGELRIEEVGQSVTLSGWVDRWRDHGGLIFIDLRDRYGITQLVFDPRISEENHTIAEKMRAEWVISIKGKVIPRAEGMANKNLLTGDIEIEVREVEFLSQAKTAPFSISDEEINVNEELRLKYRYLDIRRGEVANRLVIRHQILKAIRDHLGGEGFVDVATPILAKSTPEGARDYLVPSRVTPGSFYALPQSPQLFKQLLMIAGMDKYYQVATCFRDEDLRASRQPEFTQIDIEMSFSTEKEFFPLIEEMHKKAFEAAGKKITTPFPRMSYKDAMENYGTDKPDLRFGMELIRLDDIAGKSDFSVFKEQLKAGGVVKGICVKGGSDISRKGIDLYTQFVSKLGIKGLAWMKMQEGGLSSNIVKFFGEELQKELIARMGIEPGDLIFIVAEKEEYTNQALDHLRRRLAKDRSLIDETAYKPLWVIDFPLFEWDAEENRLFSVHHPFTAPHHEDIPLLESDPLKVRSSGYDLVLNGHEIAGGSVRIYDGKLQEKIFGLLKLSAEDIQEKFGFFVEALQYGTPPHLGIACGLDRLVMILSGTDNIRDVIAFPKTQKASDLMMDAPSAAQLEQLDELKISVELPEQKEQASKLLNAEK